MRDNEQTRIKLLALDLDGTVLAPGNRLSQRNIDAVAAFRARGGRVVIASGRARRSALPWTERLGGAEAMICHNGAAVYDAALGLIAETRLPESVARSLVALSRNARLHFHGFAEDVWLYEGRRAGTAVYEARSGFPGVRVDFDSLPVLGFHKAMFVGEPGGEIEELAARARGLCGAAATVLFSGPGFLEIVAAGVSKAAGLGSWLARAGLGLEEVLAIGDADNDEEMLLAAGIGVAMGDAPPALRLRIGRVTGGVEEDGAAQAIEDFLAGRLT